MGQSFDKRLSLDLRSFKSKNQRLRMINNVVKLKDVTCRVIIKTANNTPYSFSILLALIASRKLGFPVLSGVAIGASSVTIAACCLDLIWSRKEGTAGRAATSGPPFFRALI